MHEHMEKFHFYQNPKNGRAHTLFKTAAALLYPRFVCWESWWLQNMLISAWFKFSKEVNFGVVFFGFSLHHLFLHMNLKKSNSILLAASFRLRGSRGNMRGSMVLWDQLKRHFGVSVKSSTSTSTLLFILWIKPYLAVLQVSAIFVRGWRQQGVQNGAGLGAKLPCATERSWRGWRAKKRCNIRQPIRIRKGRCTERRALHRRPNYLLRLRLTFDTHDVIGLRHALFLKYRYRYPPRQSKPTSFS